ncbi:hypothetical protein L6R52_35300 [Myxococcota bacterium]|nr:hypothetical protein [Myxococcota bacterium]
MRTTKADPQQLRTQTAQTATTKPAAQTSQASQTAQTSKPGALDVLQTGHDAIGQLIGQDQTSQTGQTGQIGGTGTIGRPTPKKVKEGSWVELSGRVAVRDGMMGIGGETPPNGSYLVLDRPIRVGSKTVKEVFLFGRDAAHGESAKLHGRLDRATWGGVARPETEYFRLSGITSPATGEPRFDGKDFIDARGEKLFVLRDDRPQMYDAPARLFVFDALKETVYLASMGGHIPPTMNPFHGIRGSTALQRPSDADRAAVAFGADGVAKNAAGEALELLSELHEPEGQSDRMSTAYWLDRGAGKIYGFQSGGIAGFVNRMVSVIATEEA